MFSLKKYGTLNPCKFLTYHITFGLNIGLEYFYWIIDVLLNQTKCEVKRLQVQVYMQQRFFDEQGTKFT